MSDTRTPVEATTRQDPPRVLTADRRQLQWRACDLEATLPPDHAARAIWSALEQLDLARFYAPIAARGSEPGRPAIDPRILLALWLYATSQAVGSAREIARRGETDDAYRWICGGVSVNHHTVSDFRVGHLAALDELMTQVLAVLSRASRSVRVNETLRRCIDGTCRTDEVRRNQ